MIETKTATRTDATTAKAKPSSSRLLVRAALVLWWIFVAAAVVNIAQSLGGKAGPALLQVLPNLFDMVRHCVPLVQAIAGVTALVVVAFMAWLTWLAWQAKQIALQEQAAAEHEEHVSAAQEGAVRALEPMLPVLAQTAQDAHTGVVQGEAILEKVTVIAERVEQVIPATPATVVAPTGLPRPASLLGRDDELNTLLAGLRQGRAVGVFALKGMGGIGKSALAAEAVAQLAEDRAAFPGGAAWISAEGLTGADGMAEVWARVARALDLEQVAALTDPERRRFELARALAGRDRTLLGLPSTTSRKASTAKRSSARWPCRGTRRSSSRPARRYSRPRSSLSNCTPCPIPTPAHCSPSACASPT